jgi:hypothetical protein
VEEGSGGLETPLFLTFTPDAPDTGCTYDLVADGGSPDTAVFVGSVSIEYDATDKAWAVTYETTGDWWIYETHLVAVCGPADFPMTGSGNPQVGKFMFQNYGRSQQVTFSMPDPGCTDDTYFAAHAVVVDESDCWDTDGNGIPDTCREETGWADCDGAYNFPGRNWATYVATGPEGCDN